MIRLSTPGAAARWSLALDLPELATAAIPFRSEFVREVPVRGYQYRLIRKVVDAMRAGKRRILVVLPCGGGKTVMAAAMLNSVSAMALTGMFGVHRRELIDQTSQSFDRFDLDHSFVAAGRPMDLGADVLLAGVQTLVNKLGEVLPPNTLILDEAHHCTAATWIRIMEAYRDSYVVGLTATPTDLAGRGLAEHFDILIEGPTAAELIEQGYLSEFDYYAPTTPDLGGVEARAGDFVQEQIEELMDRPGLVGDTVEHYLRLAPGEQGIVFAVSREHSRHLADAFNGNGIRAAHIDGAMNDKERARIDAAYRCGDIRIMTNVDLFGEGYDVPNMVYCGLDRPTKSLRLHIQQSMRPLRPAPGKRAIICDHAGNAVQQGLGLPDSPRTWTLEGKVKGSKSKSSDDATPVRQCATCFRVSPSTVRVCSGCESEFPIVQRKLKQTDGKLEKIVAAEAKVAAARTRKDEERMCGNFPDFEALAARRGYKDPSGWARVQMRLRGW